MMHTLALYSLFLSGALLIMWLACRIIGTPRRSMILSAILFALVAAAVPFFMTKEVGAISIEPGTIEVIETTTIQPVEQPINWLLAVYIIGLIISALYLLLTLGRIAWIIMRSEPNGGIRLHDRTDLVPFTWGRWIIMSRQDYNDHKEILLAHETAHLRSAHWLDLLALGVVECITWYCPAARLLRRQLIAAHEYTADAAVLAAGVAPTDYQMLLIEKASGRRFANSVTACINHNSLKNRILMMQNPSLWQRARLRALALVPAGILVLAIATSPVLAQKPVINIETPAAVAAPERKVVDDVEVRPEFPGGKLAMMDFLRKNLRYPEKAYKSNTQGRVVVCFVVETDGSVSNIEIVRGVSEDLDAEAKRIVSTFPKWTPGKQDGQPVAVRYHLPILFKLAPEQKK